MNRIRLTAGIATIALVAGLSSTSAVAQTGGTTVANAPASAKAIARKKAAERREARRKQREARIAAARQAAGQGNVGKGDEPVGEIVVTGTRIAGNYGRTGAPVQTIGEPELARRGLARLDDVMNSLPSVRPSLGNQTRNSNNDASSFGSSPVNLRGLGPSRTLVLINGQRTTNDTNTIPAAMLERVEILTGGASAIYGSDAIGGVVNYILKRNFTGITVDGEGSFFQHRNDNEEMRGLIAAARLKLPPRNFIGAPQGYINGTAGINFAGGRGNLTAHAGYRVTTNLPANKYDTTACYLANGPSDTTPPGGFNDRSRRFCANPASSNPYGRFSVLGIPAGRPGGPTTGGEFSNAADGSRAFRPYTETDSILRQNQEFLYRNDNRFDWGVNARFTVDEASKSEISATYSHVRYSTVSEADNFSPTFAFAGAAGVPVNCDNPYLSAQQAAILCGTQAGNPQANGLLFFALYWPENGKSVWRNTSNERRATGQFKGKLTNDIRYETNIVWTEYQRRSEFNFNFSPRRFANGLRARLVNGQIVCLPPIPAAVTNDIGLNQRNLADDAACQPIDVFRAGGLSEAARTYLTENPGVYNSRNRDLVINGTIAGSLGAYGIRSPFARDGVGFSLNVESRRTSFGQVSSGSVYDLPVTTLFRELDLSGELAVPLVQDKPFLKYLQASGAFRRMDFFGSTGNTWRVGVDNRVSDEFAIRASYSTSYRVDQFQTLTPTRIDAGQGAPRLLDLCSPPGGARPSVQRLTQTQCLAFGVTAEQYAALSTRRDCDEAGRCPGNILLGGNRDLKPEQGKSFTAGLTFTPKIVPNLLFSVDYYRNKVTQFIDYVDPYIAFTQCRAGEPFYCNRYNRDPVTGRIDVPGSFADGRPTNFGSQINSGIDFNTDYRFSTADLLHRNLGDIGLNFTGNLRLKNEQQKLPGSPAFDCTGYYGYGGRENCGAAASPGWRHNVRVVWALPWSNLALNALWRFTSSVKYAGLQTNPILSTPPTATDIVVAERDAYLPSSSFFDLGATIKLGKVSSMRLTITNIFDKSPYTLVNANGGWNNTQPLMYDLFGRKIIFGFNTAF